MFDPKEGPVATIIGDIADGIARGVDTALSTVSEAFFEPVIRLGVTGLSRAGKTVFITSLVANLMNRGRMPQLLSRPPTGRSARPISSRSPTTPCRASTSRRIWPRSPA
jgi:hypothetical protein